MNLRAEVDVVDSEGAVITGLDVYITGNGLTSSTLALVEDSNRAGHYAIDIPDTFMYKTYDVYITGASYNPYAENVNFGEWIWVVRNHTVSDGSSVNYEDLTDISGNALPAEITNPVIEIVHKTDRLVYVSPLSISSASFILNASAAGEDTITVDLIIKVGA